MFGTSRGRQLKLKIKVREPALPEQTVNTRLVVLVLYDIATRQVFAINPWNENTIFDGDNILGFSRSKLEEFEKKGLIRRPDLKSVRQIFLPGIGQTIFRGTDYYFVYCAVDRFPFHPSRTIIHYELLERGNKPSIQWTVMAAEQALEIGNRSNQVVA